MITKEVTVSGAVGKQVYDTSLVTSAGNQKVVLRGVVLYAPTSAATVEVRQANASGQVEIALASPAQDSRPLDLGNKGVRFDKGMHVEVIGTGAKAYLLID